MINEEIIQKIENWKNELMNIQDPNGIYFMNTLGQHEVESIERFIDKILKLQRENMVNSLWQVREDWRNDGQIQVLSTADYLISLITKQD